MSRGRHGHLDAGRPDIRIARAIPDHKLVDADALQSGCEDHPRRLEGRRLAVAGFEGERRKDERFGGCLEGI